MKLYKISAKTEDIEYETYDSAVVVSDTEEKARLIHPSGANIWNSLLSKWDDDDEWSPPDKVEVEYIGVARKGLQSGTVICASFNAG